MRGAALVLSGGGARAAYQAGAVAALAEQAPDLQFEIVSGVSAGAIGALFFAAHPGPLGAAARALDGIWRGITTERVLRMQRPRLTGPGAHGLFDMSPLRDVLGATIDLAGIDANLRAGRLRAAALSATSLTSGETVTFVETREAMVPWNRVHRRAVLTRLTFDHVLASAAIPLVFPAVRVGGDWFGDGGVRQTAPLAPAVHLGARGVVAIAAGVSDPAPSPAAGYPGAAQVLGILFNAIFLDNLEADAERLARVNRLLTALPPGAAAPEALRPIALLVLKPSRDLGVMARDFHARHALAVRIALRALGARREGAAEFLSYMFFEPAYTGAVADLGYEDTRRRRADVDAFLAQLA